MNPEYKMIADDVALQVETKALVKYHHELDLAIASKRDYRLVPEFSSAAAKHRKLLVKQKLLARANEGDCEAAAYARSRKWLPPLFTAIAAE